MSLTGNFNNQIDYLAPYLLESSANIWSGEQLKQNQVIFDNNNHDFS